QIRLFCHEIKQPLLVRLERRTTVTGPRFGRDVARPAPPIEPTHCRGGCEIEHTRDLPPALSLLDHRNRTLPQVFRVPLPHGFPPSVSTEHSNLICATAGIPRGNSDSHQAETALVAELVGLKVDVLVAQSNAAAVAAKNATQTIPIIVIAF